MAYASSLTFPVPQTPPQKVRECPVQTLPTDYATQTHAAAVVTFPAVAGWAHSIAGVAWSYSGGTLAGGALTIADGTNTIFSVDITTAGANSVLFTVPKVGTPGQAMTITLADGSASVVGKVTADGHILIPNLSVLNGVDFSDPNNSGYAGTL